MMNYNEFRKSLESLTDEARDILTKAFMNHLDELMNDINSATLYAKKVAELPDDFGMTIEN